MTAFATRIQTGTAACVIAAAAVLTPTAVAHAGPAAPLPAAGIGAGLCDPETSPNCDVTVAPFAIPSGPSSIVAGNHPILQNPLWWFGTPNPSPPTQTTVFTFYPLALLPGFIRPLFGWFNNINFEACIGGLTLHVGPYGTISGSYSRGCA
jgi:hypothetical protein